MTAETNILINNIVLSSKINALKLTLSEKQLELYHNHLIDEAEKIKPLLYDILKSPDKVDEVLTNYLK